MSEWIDVPAQRLLKITGAELDAEFDLVGENGGEAGWGEKVVLMVRKSDRRVFRAAEFRPITSAVFRNKSDQPCFIREM